MLTVHHRATSQSDQNVWLCEELEVAFELKRYERDPVTRFAPPEYGALHPICTTPVITNGGLVVGESAAIIDYVIHQHGYGRLSVAPDNANYSDYLFWFHFANGSFMPAAMIGMFAGILAAGGCAAVSALTQRLDRAWDMVKDRLTESPFLAGANFTAADIMSLFPLSQYRGVPATDRFAQSLPACDGQG
jgi:glutathione S-transferase